MEGVRRKKEIATQQGGGGAADIEKADKKIETRNAQRGPRNQAAGSGGEGAKKAAQKPSRKHAVGQMKRRTKQEPKAKKLLRAAKYTTEKERRGRRREWVRRG